MNVGSYIRQKIIPSGYVRDGTPPSNWASAGQPYRIYSTASRRFPPKWRSGSSERSAPISRRCLIYKQRWTETAGAKKTGAVAVGCLRAELPRNQG